jgi:hypothetical protein
MSVRQRRDQRAHDPRYRKVDTQEPRPRFLIVCEGARTEPAYFLAFRASKRISVEVQGLGMGPIRLVREAIRLRSEMEYLHQGD